MDDLRTASPFVARTETGDERLELVVNGMHCAGCMQKIEGGLKGLPGITHARAHLSTRRVTAEWEAGALTPDQVIDRLEALGYPAVPFNPGQTDKAGEAEAKDLMRCLAVAGFVSANLMLFSVAIWAGLVEDMDVATRSLFQWLSALLGLPAVAYAGRPFFRSAWGAVKRGAMNMDVPISVAVILTVAASVMEMMRGAEHVYFDGSVMLLFFLLIGRVLDQRMRGRASEAAQNLLALRAVAAVVVHDDGSRETVPVSALEPGMTVTVAAGMRIPADGVVKGGASDVDASIVTGESLPVAATTGTKVYAGTLNLSAALTIEVTATEDGSLLSDIARMMEAAEQGRAGYVRIADRAATIYAPAVHLLAAGAGIGWLVFGAGWHDALMIAVAVLIITCPCALGLAVPVAQVVAAGRLFGAGILVKSGDALERLAAVDTVVFDKTGTLTEGSPVFVADDNVDPGLVAEAASLARDSHHPLALALARHAPHTGPGFEDVREEPGAGLSGRLDGATARLGRAEFVGNGATAGEGMEIWYAKGDAPAIRFRFEDNLRADAADVVAKLDRLGLQRVLLSGDRQGAVAAVATKLGFRDFAAECRPGDKIARLEALTSAGDLPLMVGDGLNDAPSLRAAHASMSPAEAADIAQVAADVVFQGKALKPVVTAITVARQTQRIVKQNFALAIGYNVIAVPMAVAGLVNPLVAAIAMSASSIVVVLNSLRLAKATGDRA